MSASRRSRWPWLLAAAIAVIGGVIYSRVHAQNAAAPARNRQTTGALPVVGAARRSPTVERAQFEHAIAILVGKAPADVTIGPGTADTTPPVIA